MNEKIKEKYKDELNDYVCCVCMEICCISPVVLNCCGNIFCVGCLEKNENQNCPMCREKYKRDEIVISKYILKQINSKKVKCFRGCNVSFQYSDLNKHEEICKEKKMKCNNEGCKEKIKRSEYFEHSINCKYRKFQCRCGMNILFRESENHTTNECNLRTINCIYCNGEYIFNNEEKHFSMCIGFLHECKNIGCKFKGKKDDLLKHSDKCKFTETNNIIVELQNKIKLLENKHSNMFGCNIHTLVFSKEDILLGKKSQIIRTSDFQSYVEVTNAFDIEEFIVSLNIRMIKNEERTYNIYECIELFGNDQKYKKEFEVFITNKKGIISALPISKIKDDNNYLIVNYKIKK